MGRIRLALISRVPARAEVEVGGVRMVCFKIRRPEPQQREWGASRNGTICAWRYSPSSLAASSSTSARLPVGWSAAMK